MKIKTLFDKEFRLEVSDVEPHWRSSLIIRIVTIILLTVVACVISLQSLFGGMEFFVYIGIGFSGVWTLVVVMCRLFMVKPIHPGVHVGFELVLWTGLSAVIAFEYSSSMFASHGPVVYKWAYRSTTTSIWIANLFACAMMTIVT